MQAGIHHTIPSVRSGLDMFARKLPSTLEGTAPAIFARLAARVTGTYMRNAGVGAGPRQPGDSGLLRIVSTRLVRSFTGAAFLGRREGIREVETSGLKVTLRFGSRVPYAGHEHGFSGSALVPAHQRTITQAFGRPIQPQVISVRQHTRQMNIEARPYLAPALRAETRWIAEHAGASVLRLAQETIGGSA